MTEQEIIQILDTYFQRGDNSKRFLDTSRIPFICDDIKKIREEMEKVATTKTSDDHEGRIRLLEKNMWRNAGIASVLGALGMWALQRFF